MKVNSLKAILLHNLFVSSAMPFRMQGIVKGGSEGLKMDIIDIKLFIMWKMGGD